MLPVRDWRYVSHEHVSSDTLKMKEDSIHAQGKEQRAVHCPQHILKVHQKKAGWDLNHYRG